MNAWLIPLLATLLMQIMNAFFSRCISALAPALTANAGIDPAMIGVFAGLGTVATILALAAMVPLIRRFGPVRTLQAGVALASFGILAAALPHWAPLLVASILVGVGYGPSAPAGSDILMRHAPPARRNLIFAIKQSGVPLGGALAGFLMPRLVFGDDVSWAVLAACAIGIASIIAVQAARERIDAGRDPSQPAGLAEVFSWSSIVQPLKLISAVPGLRTLIFAGFCFAYCQGALIAFMTTFLVETIGVSLARAGGIFAIFHVTGAFGRILVGWISDLTGSARAALVVLGVLSAATAAAFALMTQAWPAWMIAAISASAGITVTSWNALMLSETARLAPGGKVAEVTAGTTMLVFFGYVFGPVIFALAVKISGGFTLAFLSLSVLAAAASAALAAPVKASAAGR